ncbi:hypothetical protein, partial [Bifidobacterium mongoliense]
MTSPFFLSRLASEPHAFVFGGQGTPWTSALADSCSDPTIDATLHEHMDAVGRLLVAVNADLLATVGHPVDVFGFEANPRAPRRRGRRHRQR